MDQTEPFVHLGGLSKERNAEEGRKGNFLYKEKKKNRRNGLLYDNKMKKDAIINIKVIPMKLKYSCYGKLKCIRNI